MSDIININLLIFIRNWNYFYSSAEVDNIIDHIKIIHTIDPFFNFECLNRLPIGCRRKFLTYLGLEKHLKRGCGSSVAMIMVQFEDSLCQRSEVQISIRSSLFRDNFLWKEKIRWFMGPTTTVLHSQPSDTYWARLGRKTQTKTKTKKSLCHNKQIHDCN